MMRDCAIFFLIACVRTHWFSLYITFTIVVRGNKPRESKKKIRADSADNSEYKYTDMFLFISGVIRSIQELSRKYQ